MAFVLCLDTLGNSDNLHLHVSKPPKEGSPQHALLKELEMVRSLEIMQPSLLLEVCTGSKLKPEPGPYPSGTVKFRARTRPEIPPPPPPPHNEKKRKKAAFHDCMQRDGLIKALPFHKHLPVRKVCEHQVQRSHTFCRVYEFCMDKKMMTVQIMVIFCQLRRVSIMSTLNQTSDLK